MRTPPFLLSFSSLEEYLRALSDSDRAEKGSEINNLVAQQLPPVVSKKCLATLFGFSNSFIDTLHRRTERYYRIFEIPKGKKKRIIQAPRVALKVIQKWFAHYLANSLNLHEAVFGFVKGRSAVQGAALHCGAHWIYSVDIEDFFPTTSIDKVISSLTNLGYGYPGAALIAKLCCYEGNLAQGSPASPVLSNLVFREIDEELFTLSKQNGICYTRYADDIVFSGINSFPDHIREEVISIIQARGWKLSIKKIHLAKRPYRLKVYGLLIHGERPRLTKGYRNRIRAFKHLFADGKIPEDEISKIRGHLSYAHSIEEFEMMPKDDL
ncbi:MAG: RNA-directed DNA polymerase [Nitrospirae bacterium]|nr:RNA-directed DNA polymerase [Nitrospirota bacterium]